MRQPSSTLPLSLNSVDGADAETGSLSLKRSHEALEEEASGWESVEWPLYDTPPAEVWKELEERLAPLLKCLRPLEIQLRTQVIEHGTRMEQDATIGRIRAEKDTTYIETDMVLLFGIPVGIEKPTLCALVQNIAQASALRLDTPAAISAIADGSWAEPCHDHSNFTHMFLQLTEKKIFGHNAPRQMLGISPTICLLNDQTRTPTPAEKRGFKPATMVVGLQAVTHRRRDRTLCTTTICNVRGLRMATGALEDSFAILSADYRERIKEAVSLFPEVMIECEARHRWVWKTPSKINTKDNGYMNAPEVYAAIFIISAGQEEEVEALSALRMALGLTGGRSYNIVTRAGLPLVYCLDASEQMNNNFSSAFHSSHPGPISVISNVRNDISEHECLVALARGGAPVQNIWRIFLSFQLGLDERHLWMDSVDTEGRIIDALAASLHIIWKPEPDGEQIAGTVPQAALLIICILDALGRARGGHSNNSCEVGITEMQQLNLVTVAAQRSLGRNSLHKKTQLATKLCAGGLWTWAGSESRTSSSKVPPLVARQTPRPLPEARYQDRDRTPSPPTRD
jgi:hypothetical protein